MISHAGPRWDELSLADVNCPRNISSFDKLCNDMGRTVYVNRLKVQKRGGGLETYILVNIKKFPFQAIIRDIVQGANCIWSQ
jgi:hypothetical protein